MPKKLSLYKSIKTERGWRYGKVAFHPNAKVKPNIVIVDGQEERHSKGANFTLSDEKWVALGEDALHAQRKLITMNAQRKYERIGQPPQQRESAVPAGSGERRSQIHSRWDGAVPRRTGRCTTAGEERAHEQELPERVRRPHEETVHRRTGVPGRRTSGPDVFGRQ